MTAPVRDRPEFHQARKSIYQLSERLNDFGWLLTVPDEDLGEDLIVHIYYQGKATGVLFHVQVKSVTNLNQRRKKDHVPYPIEVTDLLHWESFELPVVLIVWDVAQREGRWLFLSQAIEKLNQTQPEWRQQQKKTLHIPWTNRTDDTGLIALKQQIGRYLYPLLAKDKQLNIEMKVSFPLTNSAGQEALNAFERFTQEGEQVTIKGTFIDELRFSDWYSIWFGEYDPNSIEITIGPNTSNQKIHVEVQVICNDSSTSAIQNIELKVEKKSIDNEYIQVSNYHQTGDPFHLQLISRRVSGKSQLNINLSEVKLAGDPYSIREQLKFWNCFSSGGWLRIKFLTEDHLVIQEYFSPQPQFEWEPKYVQLIDQLCFIQSRIGMSFYVPVQGISISDGETILELYTILKCGESITEHQNVELEISFESNNLRALETLDLQHRMGNEKRIFKIPSEESWFELLGQRIPTGRLIRHLSGAIVEPPEEFARLVSNALINKHLKVSLVDTQIIDVFPDFFIKEANRLGKLLVQRFSFTHLYLFGSVIWGDDINPQTDLDLAVEGLNSSDFFEAIAYLEGLTEFPFDLIALESAPFALRERIINEGKLLYEQKTGSTGLTANGSTHRI